MADFVPRSAFAGWIAAVGPAPAGVFVAERAGLGLAAVEPRKGRAPELIARVETTYGLALRSGPMRVAAGPIAFLGVGPNRWLAVSEPASVVEGLTRELDGLASVVALTGGSAVLRIFGPHARDTFAKGLPIDLDPNVFAVGAVASSVIAHIAVTVWRIDEAVYDVAVPRSFAGDFWHWLAASAGEFGLAVGGDEQEEPTGA